MFCQQDDFQMFIYFIVKWEGKGEKQFEDEVKGQG